MNRVELIESLLARSKRKRYCEIGTGSFATYDAIEARHKQGVDPFPSRAVTDDIFVGTSDEFFAQNDKQFDVVFVDGLHYADQCLKDIHSAVACSRWVVVHDVNPENEAQTIIPRGKQVQWCGSVFRAWAGILQRTIYAKTYLDDWGLGVLDSERVDRPFAVNKDMTLEGYRDLLLSHPGTVEATG